MSQSPSEDSTSDEILAYDKGWVALNRLIRRGHSFSGRERNCCFLNVGATRFANISAAVDLNLIDDGRGLATTDWDWDGRTDFWVTNRTGPRVRFLKNEYGSECDFLSMRLVGVRSNRDGIGARVNVFLVGQDRPFMRTVYAGNGYLSQSSKWLHFGLGDSAQVQRVVVHWPGGEIEEFSDVQANRRYRLVEGTGTAKPWNAPKVGRWQPSQEQNPPNSSSSRVVLLEPAPLPNLLRYQTLDGHDRPFVDSRNTSRGLLINLWATWCPNCSDEITDWSKYESAFQDIGLRVLMLCVDEQAEDAASHRQRVAEVAEMLNTPFDVGVGDRRSVEILNAFQRAFIGRQTDLPLPCSFLIDDQGRLAVIYKGPVSAEQLLEDVHLLNAPRDEIYRRAVPFRGQWLERPPTTVPRFAAVSLVQQGYVDEAEAYVRQLLPLYEPLATDADGQENKLKKQEYSSLCHFFGAMLYDRQEYEQAREYYETSLRFNPNSRGVREELLRTLTQMGLLEPSAEQLEALLDGRRNDPENLARLARIRSQLDQHQKAIELFEESIAIAPNVELQFELANLLREQRDYKRAIEHYRAVMAKVASPAVVNNLAWLLATASDDQVRNGVEALRLAREAAEATSRTSPIVLGTLAAAHAEQGDFDAAMRITREAMERAQEVNELEAIADLRQRLGQYANKQPTRD